MDEDQASLIRKLNQDECDSLLIRFRGEPGVTKGLSEEELLSLLAFLVSTGQLDANPDMKPWLEAYNEGGFLPDDFPSGPSKEE